MEHRWGCRSLRLSVYWPNGRRAATGNARDVERARVLAERKGLRYQAYIKMLVHEGLEREERRTVARGGW